MFRCASCNKTTLTNYSAIDAHVILQCTSCGLLITKTNDAEIIKYVNKQYGELYVHGYEQELLKFHKRFKKLIILINKYLNNGKLLDVGCGTGHFLKYLNDTTNSWALFGVEPNERLRKIASKTVGATIKNGSLKNIRFNNNTFDIITCLDVLEHSIELEKNLSELRRVLKTNGYILVQAPNYKSFMAYITGKRWDWWCIPDHVLHFSYNFLTNYFRENGFRIIENYTYEDSRDFLSNIRGVFSKNYLTKALFIILIPLLLVVEQIGWRINRGGLTVILAQKI